jgi:hypothetical protein
MQEMVVGILEARRHEKNLLLRGDGDNVLKTVGNAPKATLDELDRKMVDAARKDQAACDAARKDQLDEMKQVVADANRNSLVFTLLFLIAGLVASFFVIRDIMRSIKTETRAAVPVTVQPGGFP